MGEERVVALDRHHRLPRARLVAVVERVDGQLVPVVGAELEDRDRLVHAAQHGVLLLEDLHDHARVAPVPEQRLAGVVEVDVGVVALPHLLDREVEDLRWEAALPSRSPLAGDSRGARVVQLTGSRRRHSWRAAFATSSCSCEGSAVTRRCCSSCPGRASARASGWRSLATIQEKTSTAAATEPTPAASGQRAQVPAAPARRALPAAVVDEERADHVRAAALVLPRARLAVLVAPDRDVLGAVVLGERRTAERHRRGPEREQRGQRLLRAGLRPRAEAAWMATMLPAMAPSTPGRWKGSFASGRRAAHRREEREDLGDARGAADEPSFDVHRAQRLAARGDLQLAVVGANGTGPVPRPVHEHPVRERHPARAREPVAHVPE